MEFSEDYYLMAISDLHLGFKDKSFTDPHLRFSSFLDDLKTVDRIDHFIILGDFVDLWRRNDIEVMKEQDDLLNRLVKMKDGKKIGTLHYLVGNHDYIVPWYVKWGYIFRRFSNTRSNLQQFSIRKASCTDIDSLVLTDSPDGNIYTFRHGHQDNEATLVAPGVYDGISILLCSSGNITGSFFSWIWANRYYIPHFLTLVFTILAIYTASSMNLLWTGIYGSFAIASLLVAIWIMRKNTFKAARDVKRILKENRKKLSEYKEELVKSGKEQDEIQIQLQTRQYQYQEDIIRQWKDPDLLKEQSTKYEGGRSFVIKMHPEEYRVLGHTHEMEVGPPEWNTGAWVENKPCLYFAITRNGQIEFNQI